MRFLVARYAKDEDSPDSVTDVSSAGVDAFSALLGIPPSGLTDVYPLGQEHAEAFRRLTGMGLDLDHYEYFLEVEAD
ncbi:hypothetical protein ABT173_05875 [Streptomyces sp. NPDC001795]|uniref:DUF7683 domain-containing protein n=1 Tax=unclassified Streptomyces TaxID=2593676 RepID=UPI00332EE2DF